MLFLFIIYLAIILGVIICPYKWYQSPTEWQKAISVTKSDISNLIGCIMFCHSKWHWYHALSLVENFFSKFLKNSNFQKKFKILKKFQKNVQNVPKIQIFKKSSKFSKHSKNSKKFKISKQNRNFQKTPRIQTFFLELDSSWRYFVFYKHKPF